MRSSDGGQTRFANVPQANIQRSVFDRSCAYKTTLDAGDLVPFFTDEVLPGDTMNLSASLLGRFATPLHPLMDNVYLDTHFFFVPNRLLWDNFTKMMGDQTNPGDSTDYLVPLLYETGGVVSGSMSDYFGIPVTGTTLTPTALFHRAYNLIWNEWFRDENLQDRVLENRDDGPDAQADYAIKKRGKRHDYFTSCLPWPQKGDAVEIPLGSTAPVTLDTPASVIGTSNGEPTFNTGGQSGVKLQGGDGSTNNAIWNQSLGASPTNAGWNTTELEITNNEFSATADLSSASAVTINALREAVQAQKFLEKDARGGTRYTESNRVHFGVTSPDARLQRPEYLGGGTTNLNFTTVAQTSKSTPSAADPSEQGSLAAYGIAASNGGNGFTKSFTEHGVIIGFVSARADLNYQQGMNRQFLRRTRFDFPFPTFAHLGEQAVTNIEIYTQGDANDDLVFGYQERFAECRYKPSLVTSQMRSSFPQSLDTWHLAQEFENLPVLDDEFIQENPPIDRTIAVVDEPHFILDTFFTIRHARPLPTYGVPGQMDRF